MHRVNHGHRGVGTSPHLGWLPRRCARSATLRGPQRTRGGVFKGGSELLVSHTGGWLGGVGGGKQYLFLREGCRSSDRVRDGGV